MNKKNLKHTNFSLIAFTRKKYKKSYIKNFESQIILYKSNDFVHLNSFLQKINSIVMRKG